MEGRRVGNRLDMVCVLEVGIGPGDGRSISDGDCLRKSCAKIRIGSTAIPDIPASVYVEVHQVGQTSDLLRARCLASQQDAKLIEVDWVRSLGFQVSVKKIGMADFVDCITGDVLRTVTIEELQSQLVVVLGPLGNATEFRVLQPQIAFDQLGRCQKSKNGYISLGELASTLLAQCDIASAE